MALIKCPECGKEFSDKASACPNCGCPTSEINTSSNSNNSSEDELSSIWSTIPSTILVLKSFIDCRRQMKEFYH